MIESVSPMFLVRPGPLDGHDPYTFLPGDLVVYGLGTRARRPWVGIVVSTADRGWADEDTRSTNDVGVLWAQNRETSR